MTRVMLICDSIRMGYQDEVKKELGSSYLVWSSDENARFVKYTLKLPIM